MEIKSGVEKREENTIQITLVKWNFGWVGGFCGGHKIRGKWEIYWD